MRNEKQASQTLEFCLSGPIVPKARPRQYNGYIFLPENYRRWKNQAVLDLVRQRSKYDFIFPLQHAAVVINLEGKHNRRGDIDNICGSLFDALVQADILKEDNLSVIDDLSIKFQSSKIFPVATIQLYPS